MKKVRRQKIVGTQTFINRDTGEILESVVVEKNVDKDFNWHKIWLQDLLNILELIGTKKLVIIKWILNHMNDKDNIVYFTQRALANELKMSLKTINETIKILLEVDFMRKKQNGVYQINPNIIAKGSTGKRMNLLIKYNKIGGEK